MGLSDIGEHNVKIDLDVNPNALVVERVVTLGTRALTAAKTIAIPINR